MKRTYCTTAPILLPFYKFTYKPSFFIVLAFYHCYDKTGCQTISMPPNAIYSLFSVKIATGNIINYIDEINKYSEIFHFTVGWDEKQLVFTLHDDFEDYYNKLELTKIDTAIISTFTVHTIKLYLFLSPGINFSEVNDDGDEIYDLFNLRVILNLHNSEYYRTNKHFIEKILRPALKDMSYNNYKFIREGRRITKLCLQR